jgi:hypothetical protein
MRMHAPAERTAKSGFRFTRNVHPELSIILMQSIAGIPTLDTVRLQAPDGSTINPRAVRHDLHSVLPRNVMPESNSCKQKTCSGHIEIYISEN